MIFVSDAIASMVNLITHNPVLTVVMSVWVLAFYARPISPVEKADLLMLAEGSEKGLQLARRAALSRYVSYFTYKELERRINAVVCRERANDILLLLTK